MKEITLEKDPQVEVGATIGMASLPNGNKNMIKFKTFDPASVTHNSRYPVPYFEFRTVDSRTHR